MNSRRLLWPAQAGDAGAMGTSLVSVAHPTNVHFWLKIEAIRGQQRGQAPGLPLKKGVHSYCGGKESMA